MGSGLILFAPAVLPVCAAPSARAFSMEPPLSRAVVTRNAKRVAEEIAEEEIEDDLHEEVLAAEQAAAVPKKKSRRSQTPLQGAFLLRVLCRKAQLDDRTYNALVSMMDGEARNVSDYTLMPSFPLTCVVPPLQLLRGHKD